MEALVTCLTREKLLVELLVFKLVSMRQLLLTGETRFLPWAAEEVDRATNAVRDAELERAVLASMAQEMTSFSRNQILNQAGTAMLAQANQASQGVLSLLRG